MTPLSRYLGFSLLLLSGFEPGIAAGAEYLPASPGTSADAPGMPAWIAYDQLDATLPQDLVSIPAVVIAEVNIALHQARKRAADKLCAGRWTPLGAKVRETGPLISGLPDTHDTTEQTWTYRAFRKPEDLACGSVTRSRFFQEVSRYLPAWISIRPAAQFVAYRQGIAVGPVRESVIATR